ncbi:MAG: hypothetical protein JXA74_04780 [Anaerolineae bacterium]|nr:hypothetical protein [Anaerolineae bacterium]
MTVRPATASVPAGGLRWRWHLAVLALFALLTAIMTWPLVVHFGSAVLGPPGDNLEYVWKMWWFKHALLDLKVSPFFNPDVFYPFGYPLALSETTMANTVLWLPITALFGETVAYNAAMYLSFVLSGYGLFLLLQDLECSALASVFGGAVFAFCPYRMSHLGAGHLPLMGTGWIALLFWAVERMLRQPSWRRGWLVGLFGGLTALSSWYYAFMVGPFVLGYALLRWLAVRHRGDTTRRSSHRDALLGWSLAIIMGGLLLAPAAVQTVKLYRGGQMGYSHSLAYVDQWSASPVDFIYPNAMHSLWGAGLTRSYCQNINENLIYLGWVSLILALFGLVCSLRASDRRGRCLKVYAGLGAAAFVLALGTTLHYAGEPVYLRVPAAVEYQVSRVLYVLTGRLALNKVSYGAMQREGAIILPMPTLLLYLFVPFMSAMRVWSRFGLLVVLSVAVLSARGLDVVLTRPARSGQQAPGMGRTCLGMGLLLLALLDLSVLPYAYGYTEVRGQPVDEWLAAQSGDGAIMHYPLEKTWYGWMLYPQRVHRHAMAYGYGTFAPEAYEEAAETLAGWPAESALEQLRSWRVRYVLVGAHSYGPEWPRIEARIAELEGLQAIGVWQDRPLFRGDRLLHLVEPRADVPSTELINGDRQAFLNDQIHVYEIRQEAHAAHAWGAK